jgi:3-oxoacyl-[acyl-carrier protein] reductase
MNLKGRVALVTGAGRGIGKAIGLRLAGAGAAVAVNDLKLEYTTQAIEEITALGVPALAVPADVSSSAEVNAMVEAVIAKFGRLDILVNNAGIASDQILMRLTDEQWDRVINIDLKSVFLCSRAAVRHMLKAKWGRIISLASVVGLVGNYGQSNYAAAKAGITGFTRSLAREVGTRSITVNALAPGFIETDMTKQLPEKQRQELYNRIPMGYLGSAEDVAAACAFLASEDARYITGHVLTIDGGMTCI